jgi:hypothetical protein
LRWWSAAQVKPLDHLASQEHRGDIIAKSMSTNPANLTFAEAVLDHLLKFVIL